MCMATITRNNSAHQHRDKLRYSFRTPRGLSEAVVREISRQHQEPNWMLQLRLQALQLFLSKPLPTWGPDLSVIDFDAITYYLKPTDAAQATTWEDVPEKIKQTFERLGVPQAERKFLAGAGAQYESEIIYHHLQSRWQKLGVVFCDMSQAPRLYPELVKKYFASIVPIGDNSFAALNSAVWSGGSFIYVPPGVKVALPLQAYFRINAPSVGQFERTLIIVDRGASVHYIEGCTAPLYSRDSLHAAVVELIALPGSKVRYTTIQNWSDNVYNLVTKRAAAYRNARVEWVDGNLGSKLTMKYPAVLLKEPGATADILSVAYAGDGQHQDAGAKVFHLASNTKSHIVSKSVSRGGGRTSYRGLVRVLPGAKHCQVKVSCDALLLDDASATDTFPTMDIASRDAVVEHEATVSKLNAEQLHYLQSRGLTPTQAAQLIVTGFLAVFAQELPFEYAIELNRLIAMDMEGSVG